MYERIFSEKIIRQYRITIFCLRFYFRQDEAWKLSVYLLACPIALYISISTALRKILIDITF